jgi:Tol biopolymer transport system component
MGLPAGRVAIPIAVGAVALVVAVTLFLLTRDESEPVRGDVIAYSCKEQGNIWYAICVVKADGSGRRRLTHGLEASDPSWSPDGGRIVFTRHRTSGEHVSLRYDELYVVDSDGESLRKLTDNRAGFTLGEPAWSPDGRLIAFVRGRTLPVTGATFGAVFVMSADGTGARRVSSGPLDTSPSWSPDGTEVAFARADGYGSFASADVYVVSATGGKARRLTMTPRRLETEPAWSPDGRKIAFATATPETPFHGRAALHVMNREGEDDRRVAALRLFSRYPGNLAWSPDGRTIVLEVSTPEGCTTIALLGVEDPRPLARALLPCTGDADGASGPAWQPAEATGGP